MAELVGHLLVLIIPAAGVLYSMLKILPAIYDWIMRSRIFRLYGEMRLLENKMDASETRYEPTDIIARLDQLQVQANRLRVPSQYASMVYMLRSHLALVRERLTAR